MDDFFKNTADEKVSIDFRTYAVNLLTYHKINKQYLRAILESQVEI